MENEPGAVAAKATTGAAPLASSTSAATAPAGVGMIALQHDLDQGANVAAVAKTITTYPAERDAMLTLLHTRLGNLYVQSVVAAMAKPAPAAATPAAVSAPPPTAAIPLAVAIRGLTDELAAKNPALLHEIQTEIARIEGLPKDQQAAALTEGLPRLEQALDQSVAAGQLSPSGIAEWKTFRAQAEQAARAGTLLDSATGWDQSFQAERRAELEAAIEVITTELSTKAPEAIQAILEKSQQLAAIPDDKSRLDAFRTGYAQLDQFILAQADKLSPDALVKWQDVKSQVDTAITAGTVSPLAQFANEAFVHHLGDLITLEKTKIGSAPENVTLGKELQDALAALEAKASGGTVTFQMLMAIVPTLTKERALAIAPHLNQAMDTAGIKTPHERAAFIAQTAEESAAYATFKEYGNAAYFQRYEPVLKDPGTMTPAEQKQEALAKQLGNTQVGDGARFAGRGVIQLTGRANYAKASQDLFGDDRLVQHPELAETPQMAFTTATWFWNKMHLNDVLGGGSTAEFELVTKRINGGTLGWEVRLGYYTRALSAMGGAVSVVEPAKPTASATAQAVAPTTTGAFDWTTLLVTIDKSLHAPPTLSPEVTGQLRSIATARPAKLAAEQQTLGTRLTQKEWVKFGSNQGWGFGGDPDPAAPASTDRILQLAATELFTGRSIEGNTNAVVTYDGTVTIGAGWANTLGATYVAQYFARDPAARALLLDVGFTITADNQFAVIDDTGALLIGDTAHAFLRVQGNGGVLDYLSSLMAQPAAAPKAMDAAVEMLQTGTIAPLRANGVYAAMASWSDDAIRCAIHLGNWDFAGGPVVNPNDYKATAGDPLKLVQAFAKNMRHWIAGANGALIVGNSANTTKPLSGHIERWGNGVAATAIRGTKKLQMTLHDAATDASLADHVLVVDGDVFPGATAVVDIWDTGTV